MTTTDQKSPTNNTHQENIMSNQIDRRTLAKGIAWTAPVLTVAAAAPMVAASPPKPSHITGHAYKCPGKSDVPGGWPKHGYRVIVTITPQPDSVVAADVQLGNGKTAKILTQPIHLGGGQWEFVVDADSSPSKMTVTVTADGSFLTVAIKAFPHCS